MLATWLAYIRNPIALLSPTMFTEDGSWTAALYTQGVLSTYWSARPDYFVVGNVLHIHLASLLASLFGDGLPDTPVYIAALSYLFYGCVAAFPVLALRALLPLWARAAMVVLVAMVPVGVPQSSAELWGRASNIGFAFVYLLVLAIIWRETLQAEGRRIALVAADLLIVLCCATNPITIPIAFAYLGFSIWSRGFGSIRAHLPLLVALVLIAVPNAFGILEAASLEDEASAQRTASGLILSGIARPLLYPFLFPVYEHLTDAIAVTAAALLGAFLAAGLLASGERRAFAFWLLGLGFVTVVVAMTRPLLPQQMGGYLGTYPDRYFYAQNVMVLVAVVWGAARLATVERLGVLPFAVPLSLLLVVGINWPRVVIPSQVACSSVGTGFAEQIAAARPIQGRDGLVAVEICPRGWTIELPRDMR